jgi:hypothetical protein
MRLQGLFAGLWSDNAARPKTLEGFVPQLSLPLGAIPRRAGDAAREARTGSS